MPRDNSRCNFERISRQNEALIADWAIVRQLFRRGRRGEERAPRAQGLSASIGSRDFVFARIHYSTMSSQLSSFGQRTNEMFGINHGAVLPRH